MADGLNKVILIGNLGADSELHEGTSTPVLKMRIATAESFLDKDGKRRESTEWHTVVIFGKRATALAKYLVKGKSVAVEGRMQTKKWEDKKGTTHYQTSVVAANIILLGGRDKPAPAREPGDDDMPELPPSPEPTDDNFPF